MSLGSFAHRRRQLLVLATGLCVTALAGSAQAGPADAELKRRADDAFNAGKAALAAGDWQTACERFEASMQLDGSVSTLVKIARCREHEGKLVEELRTYRQALTLNASPSLDSQRQRELDELVRRAITDLEPRVPKVRVILKPSPTHAEVELDGERLGAAELSAPIALDPGSHRIVVQATGFESVTRTFDVSEGIASELLLTLEPASIPASIPAPTPAASATLATRASAAPSEAPSLPNAAREGARPFGSGSGQRVAGALLGSAGIIGLGVGAYFGVRTLTLVGQADCEQNVCSHAGANDIRRAARAQTAGFVAAGIGAGLLGAGALVFFTAKRGSTVQQPSPRAVELGITQRGVWMKAIW